MFCLVCGYTISGSAIILASNYTTGTGCFLFVLLLYIQKPTIFQSYWVEPYKHRIKHRINVSFSRTPHSVSEEARTSDPLIPSQALYHCKPWYMCSSSGLIWVQTVCKGYQQTTSSISWETDTCTVLPSKSDSDFMFC